MWTRASWHECADELDDVSQRFRRAYWGRRGGGGWPRHPDDEVEMVETSKEGVQLLRALALAVRSEQDFKLAPHTALVVGALKKEKAIPSDAMEVKKKLGYANMLEIEGYSPLLLRQALNKIAHADPQKAGYYVAPRDRAHDLLLFGEDRGQKWFAAISILELAKAIRALPDATIVGR
jgi:hypothetical protein